ncbi:MAG: GlsB/YeaQ/YmgE family stress response membrane protein [bacterium]|nr:GlsB/YeaQ/YmgE family stress response membrane protein [bacterium]
MGIIVWIIFGGLVGWVASLIMNTDGHQGIFLNIIVGVIGAVIGGWLMGLVGKGGVVGFNFYSFLVALLGACVFVAVLKAIRG